MLKHGNQIVVMTPLRKYIEIKREKGEKLLSIYLTAGFPSPEATASLLKTIADAGADLIEIGVPFSDPLADGPTIQRASQVALNNGTNLTRILSIIPDFRKDYQIPVLLMGYANPFIQYGWLNLAEAASAAGANGFIIPDLPPEESQSLFPLLARQNLDLVFLATSNSSTERLEQIRQSSSAFVYAVSLLGVTGARENLPVETTGFLQRLRQDNGPPVLVGFGISNPITAKQLSQYCDGIIIGSAVIRLIEQSQDLPSAQQKIYQFIDQVKSSINGA